VSGATILKDFTAQGKVADRFEAMFWGDARSGKERAAMVHEIAAEIIDWRNPEPVPERLAPDPPPGLRYWLGGV
jgi:hypothetical protein